MGPNLTENALQRAARSVSTLVLVCKQFDRESNVLVTTLAHTTRTDKNDIQKVVTAVLDNELSPGDGTGVLQQCDSIHCETGKERVLWNGLTKRLLEIQRSEHRQVMNKMMVVTVMTLNLQSNSPNLLFS